MSTKRRTLRMSPATAGMLISAAATLFVAVTAFRLAYAGSKGAAGDAGLNPSDAAWYPLCIEGALVVAAVGTVAVGGRYPWAMLLGFTGLSIAANIAHAHKHDQHWDLWHVVIAAVPPFALPLCVHLMISTGKHYAENRKTTPASSSSSRPVEDTTRDVDAAGPGAVPHLTPGPARDTGGVGAPADPSGPAAGAPECAEVVHLPHYPSAPAGAPARPRPSAIPSAPGARTQVRNRTSAASAPAGAPGRARVTAPAGAPKRTDNDLAGALRRVRETAGPSAGLDTIRGVARALHIGQDRASRILTMVDGQPGGDPR